MINEENIQKTNTKNNDSFIDIDHKTINYVDDSTNIIGFKNINNITEYLNKYYILLEQFYTINMLQINPDKTKMIVICKNKMRDECKNINFMAGKYNIKQDINIKILGFYLQNDMCLDRQTNNIVSK